MNFRTSITHCVAKDMGHLSDFTLVSMANLTPCRRDLYLGHVKSGLRRDTLAALSQAPLDLPTLFSDIVANRTEEDIGRFEDKGRSHGQSGGRRDNRFHPYKRLDRQKQEQKSGKPAWKQLQLLYKCSVAADPGQRNCKLCRYVSASDGNQT